MATIVTREVGATAKGSPLTNTELDNNFINLNQHIQSNADLSKDLTGFIDRTSSSISFNEGTRTFSLSPIGTLNVYYRGIAHNISSTVSLTISNVSGGRYIIYNTVSGQLEETAINSHPSILNDLLVAYIWWDASNQKAIVFGDERHSSNRDTQWHQSQHLDVGAIWRSGGNATYTLNDSSSAGIGISAPLSFADEDLVHTIIHSATPTNPYEQTLDTLASLPAVYLNGSSYVETSPSTLPWRYGANRAYYNQITNGSGSLVECSTNSYMVYWIIATNDRRYPVKAVMGHYAYGQLLAAEQETFDDYGLPMPELVPMYKVILAIKDTNTGNLAKAAIEAVYKVKDRVSSLSTGFSATSHNALSERGAADQHPISAITGLQNALDNKADDSNLVNAGAGLSGGGALSSNPSLALDVSDLAESNEGASGDYLAIYDVSLSATRKITLNNLLTGNLPIPASGVTAGTYGSSTQIPSFTVGTDGRITSAGSYAISVGEGVLTVQGNNGISGTGTFSANSSTNNTISLGLSASGVTAGTYTKVTVDAYGRTTSGSSLASSDVTTALGYTPVAATSVNRIYDSGGTGNYLLLSSANEIEFFDSSGVLQDMYLQYSGGTNSLRGPGGNIILHAGNYNNYSPSLTGANASGTWNISVTGSANSVSGLTLNNSSNGINPDNVTQNQLGYNTSVSLFGQTDGGLYSSAYSQSWIHQIYGDFRTGQIAIRGKNSGTWQAWRTVVDSSNVSSYALVQDTWIGSKYFSSGGAIYGTILYDSNDSGYYADPASTTRLNRLYLNARNDNYNVGSLNAKNSVSDWQSLTNTTGQWTVTQFEATGNYTNSPSNVYTYGSVMSWRTENHSFQLYASHTGDLTFKTQWNNDNYSGWRRILHESNYSSFAMPVGSSATNSVDVRAPIFYDSNDSSYYIDPSSTSNAALRMRGGALFGPNPTWGAYLYVGTDGRVGTEATVAVTNGNLHLDAKDGYDIYLNNYNGRWIRSPGFYDNNDTGYYIDPNSSSRLNTVNADTLRSYNNIYLDNNYGSSIIGVYSSVRYQGVFSMGDAYKLALDGTTTGNLYGIAWSHPNAGGVAGNLNTHGALILENGSFLAAISGSIRSRDDMRSPLFYDSNNTGYYCDPTSTSRLANINADEVYAYGWLRNYYSGNGLYNQATGNHWYSDGAYWNVAYNGTTGIRLRVTGHGGTVAGYYYGDTSLNSGLLNQNGSWKVRVNGSDTEIYDYMYFNDGRGYIFYDRSNTGYYVDPNSTTYVYYLQSATSVRADSDRRLKDNIKPILNALEKVRLLQGCTYTRVDLADKYKVYMGMIAQDVLPIVPEVVSGSDKGMYSLGYAEMVPLLNEAIKDLDLIVVEQSKVISNQEERIKRLEELVSKLIDN